MIERDGYPFIIGAALTALICFAADTTLSLRWAASIGWIFVVATAFFLLFFRSPHRTAPSEPGLVVSPADGTVIKIERLENYPGFNGPVDKISIFLSVLDVHVNWTPIAGTVKSVEHIPGTFSVAWLDKASLDNERSEIYLESAYGPVLFKQIAGQIARRIVCRLQPGQRVAAGEKFGMIKFSSRAEVFLAAGAEILVKPRRHIKGGQTAIARLPVLAERPRTTQTTQTERNS
ncbi:MAG TPA: phosphatidylserine decarboxylase family protein [candidate division Zixibacteria bacterium]|nr:phosphatidylserine decarboxylase family protein [candidate division Zixibacteria bacterium]